MNSRKVFPVGRMRLKVMMIEMSQLIGEGLVCMYVFVHVGGS